MSYVGLDIATETGVAAWYKGTAAPIFSTIRLPGTAGEVGRPMEALRSHLADLHSLDPITHLFFEANIVPRGKTTIQTIYKLCALCSMAEWFGHRIGAEVRQVEQASWRKHFIGRGAGPSAEMKQAAKDAARARGWNVIIDHEADALGVLDYGLSCMSVATPWRDAHLFDGAIDGRRAA